jgi:hypothetical protein
VIAIDGSLGGREASPRPPRNLSVHASSDVSECFRDLAEASERPPYLKTVTPSVPSFAITPDRWQGRRRKLNPGLWLALLLT